MRIGVSRGLILAAAIALVCAGLASAAKPVKGATYAGEFNGTPGTVTEISFKVSANGKRITDLYTQTPIKCKGGCGGVPAGENGSGKISKQGTFTVKVKLTEPGSTKTIGTDTVMGKFLSHGRASGKVTSRFGTGRPVTDPWTATS